MNQTFRSGAAFVVATLFLFGSINLMVRQSGWRQFSDPTPISGQSTGMHAADPWVWKVKKLTEQGLAPQLISLLTPVLGASPQEVSFARAQCNDLEKQIKSLDEYARRSSRGFDHERMKREVKKAREMMSGFDCENA